LPSPFTLTSIPSSLLPPAPLSSSPQ
jgi:hypothetical protein